jgi:hypothetical protein
MTAARFRYDVQTPGPYDAMGAIEGSRSSASAEVSLPAMLRLASAVLFGPRCAWA